MRKIVGLTAQLVVLVGLLAFGCGAAGAFQYVSEGSFGTFQNVQGVAVEQSSGDVYVFDAGAEAVFKFDSSGAPSDFSSSGTNEIEGVGGAGTDENEIAIDNSDNPMTKGDIYLARGGSVGASIGIYGPDGKKLAGGLHEEAGQPWGTPCGVSVGPAGDVYVGLSSGFVNRYAPSGAAVTNADYIGSLSGIDADLGGGELCNIAVNSKGDVYAEKWQVGPVKRYEVSQFNMAGEPAMGITVDNDGSTLTVNPSDEAPSQDEVLIDERDAISRYSSTGQRLGGFATLGESLGIAVDAGSGELYVGDGSKVDRFKRVVLPRVLAEGAEIDGSGVVLNGEIDPEGLSATGIEFEYGLTTAYGSTVTGSPGEATGTSSIPVTASVSGLEPNRPYYYRLAAESPNGRSESEASRFTIAVEPDVEDAGEAVSEVSQHEVTFEGGKVNPENAETYSWIEYGPDEAYGLNTVPLNIGAGVGDVVLAAQSVSELQDGTTYHYRLVAHNSAGTSFGTDHTFTTSLPRAPIVSTGSAVGVGQNTATLTGTLDTQGLSTTDGFEIGTSATELGPLTGLKSVGAGIDQAPIALDVSGLQPSTTYYYRLIATSSDGTSEGSLQSFTTGAFPDTFTAPPAPLPFVTVPSIAFPVEVKPAVVKKVTKKVKKVKRKPGRKGAKHGKKKSKGDGGSKQKKKK
jgi:hypothetical protein